MDETKVLNTRMLLAAVSVALMGWVCFDGLERMAAYWDREEYSHGYLIPFVALYLFWQKRGALANSIDSPSKLGLLGLFASLFVWLLGEVSGIFTLIQYAFIMGVFSIAMIWFGFKAAFVVWAPIFYLIFMIPLPGFIYNNLSSDLQLLSSAIGVAVIRLFDISVYLEGNVIDLGVYQLQVVEACSGLRYLFPLMSFGFLIAYIYRGPVWQKAVVFLSTIPITVLMNSFRIGVIGVTVEHFGIAAAEGFLHDFEGWIVFMACVGVLLLEIWVFYLFSSKDKQFGDLFDLDFGLDDKGTAAPNRNTAMSALHYSSLAVLALAIPLSISIVEREDIVPDRTSFATFPLAHEQWTGRQSSIEADVLDVLDLSDYFIGDYSRDDDQYAVNFYSAWYAVQRKGESIHSPRSCLPGGGWLIKRHTVEQVDGLSRKGQTLEINRVVMQMGEHKQLVYYWFEGRSRIITNEYMAKWFIFWDSMVNQRTDGALVRLVTYVPEGSDIAEADQRLNQFLSDFYDILPEYVPE